MAIETANFASSNLAAGSYDTDTRELTIEFTSGDSYIYSNVPADAWRGLRSAASAGSYFHRQIRDRYAYEQA